MPRVVLKLHDDEYVEWSTVVDAPVSYILNRVEAVREWGEDRVGRADAYTMSYVEPEYPPDSAAAAIVLNRAGADESELTLGQIREQYRSA